jgi:hypothetical protein
MKFYSYRLNILTIEFAVLILSSLLFGRIAALFTR